MWPFLNSSIYLCLSHSFVSLSFLSALSSLPCEQLHRRSVSHETGERGARGHRFSVCLDSLNTSSRCSSLSPAVRSNSRPSHSSHAKTSKRSYAVRSPLAQGCKETRRGVADSRPSNAFLLKIPVSGPRPFPFL